MSQSGQQRSSAETSYKDDTDKAEIVALRTVVVALLAFKANESKIGHEAYLKLVRRELGKVPTANFSSAEEFPNLVSAALDEIFTQAGMPA